MKSLATSITQEWDKKLRRGLSKILLTESTSSYSFSLKEVFCTSQKSYNSFPEFKLPKVIFSCAHQPSVCDL